MYAGKSKDKVGISVRIIFVNSKEDNNLVGQTGKLTHPFGCHQVDHVGIYLNSGGICSLSKSDKYEVLEG